MKSGKTIREPGRDLPVIDTDVFIVGAGTAGCIAAIAAARAGARVVLAEKHPVPGGTFTNGAIGFNSFFASTANPGNAKRIVGGLPYELARNLEEAGGATGFVPTVNDHYHSPYRFIADHEVFKAVMSRMLLESGVDVLLQTMFCGVMKEGNRITAAIIENKSGRSAVCANQYIDASGDGDIARALGLEQIEIWQEYDKVCGGPTGLVFGMSNVDFDRLVSENPGAAHPLGKVTPKEGKRLGLRRIAFSHKANPEKYRAFDGLDIEYFTSFQSIHPNEATYINNSAGVNTDASKAVNLSNAELEMRVRILKIANALQAGVPGFEDAHLHWAGTQLGVRATSVTSCDKMLTQDEITNAARFEDEIGLYAFHDLSPKRPHCLVKEPGFYGFPYRMLLPVGCDNLLMAGRCVTADVEAHMSTRNSVGCMLMGQAAGTAAALCAKDNLSTRQLPYPVLRVALLAGDVILEA